MMQEEVQTKVRVGILLTLFLISVVVYWPENGGAIFGLHGQSAGVPLGEDFCDEGELCIGFLDVGQGDASFIESPTGVQVLIDGGPDNSVVRGLGRVMGYFDKTIDVVVATHSDADHIGGLVDVLERFEVNTVVLTENKSESAVAKRFLELVDEEGSRVIYARRGQVYELGDGAEFEVLFPETDPTNMESNASSIVLRLTYGDTSALFTGDSPKRIEEYLMLAEGEHLGSDVLKVGHHGSRTSTSEMFLAEVDPDYAIISAGKDNRYGHPHVEVTDLLFNYRVVTKNTAEEGSVYMESDGTGINFRK